MPDEKKHGDLSEGRALVRVPSLPLYESHYVNLLCLSNDYLLGQYQILKLYGMCLIAKLRFDQCTWKLDCSSGEGRQPELAYYSYELTVSWNSKI